jgi:hypothetical protein
MRFPVGRVAAVMVVMQVANAVFVATAAARPEEPAATLVQPLPVAQPPPAPASTCAPPVLTIRDLDHLAEVVEPDDVLRSRTKVLARSRNNALWVAFGALVVGAALMIAGLTVYADVDCHSIPFGDVLTCMTRPSLAALAGGAAIAVGGVLVGAAVTPDRQELIDIANDWNARHPDRPIALRPRRH